MLVTGAVTVGASAHFLATFADTHLAAAALSWHDFQAVAENHSHDDESVAIRIFISEHPGYIATLGALNEDVRARAAKYPPGSAAAIALAQGSVVDAQQAEQAGPKWTLFLGVCVLLFGIAELIRLIAQSPASDGAGTRGPAVGLIIVGAINAVLVVGLWSIWFREASWAQHPVACTLVQSAFLLFAVITLLIFRGAIKMLNHENLPASRLSAICSLLSLNLVSVPVGIWALVRLSRPEVKARFSVGR